MFGAEPAFQITAGRSGVAVQRPDAGHRGELVAIARLGAVACVVHEHDFAVVAFVDQRAQHRHDGGDPTATGDEQNPPRPRLAVSAGQREVAADAGQPDHHPAPRAFVQKCRDQPAVVMSDRQLEVRGALGVGGRVAAGVSASVDFNAEVYILPGTESLAGVGERRVGRQHQGDAARGASPHIDNLRAGLGQRPRRVDLLGVPVDAVRAGEQVYQVRPQHPLLQSLSKHLYTVRFIGADSQGFMGVCVRVHNSEHSYA